jgi:superoxide dismutase, Cu-Zn family
VRLAFALGLTAILTAASAVAQTPAAPAPSSDRTAEQAPPKTPAAKARAEMSNAGGQPVGVAHFTQMAHGVLIQIELTSLPPGWHALHLHEVGLCEPPFTSAGAHFAPRRNAHGHDGENGPHAGDLPNVLIGNDGTARVEFFNERISLSSDEARNKGLLDRAIGAVESAAGVPSNSLFGEKGTALILHERADDYRTDSSGNAGDRIACGVVRPS